MTQDDLDFVRNLHNSATRPLTDDEVKRLYKVQEEARLLQRVAKTLYAGELSRREIERLKNDNI